MLQRYRQVAKSTGKTLFFNAEEEFGCMSMEDLDGMPEKERKERCYKGFPPPKPGRKRHAMNTGCFIGTASAVSKFFGYAMQSISNFTKSHTELTPKQRQTIRKLGDQMILTDLFKIDHLREEFSLDLDWDKAFFGIVGAEMTRDIPPRDITNGRWTAKHSRKKPMILHSPGQRTLRLQAAQALMRGPNVWS
eukprot:2837349-Rhodomonas_salina.2